MATELVDKVTPAGETGLVEVLPLVRAILGTNVDTRTNTNVTVIIKVNVGVNTENWDGPIKSMSPEKGKASPETPIVARKRFPTAEKKPMATSSTMKKKTYKSQATPESESLSGFMNSRSRKINSRTGYISPYSQRFISAKSPSSQK
jgi:hypothetical protein